MEKLELIHGKNYFSPSQLKKLFISVGAFNSYLNRKGYHSDQMELGSVVHKLILEPDEFDDVYAVLDDTDIIAQIGGARPTATKAYSAFVDEFKEQAGNKIVISKSIKDLAQLIYDKCSMLGIIDTFFSDGEAEKTVTGVTKGYNEDFDALCIIDYDTDFQSVDLKTTSKPLHKFKYDAYEFGYDIQASLTNSLNGKEFVFVVVQTVEPFDIGIFTISQEFLDRGKEKINQALWNYKAYDDEYSSQILRFTL